MEKKDRLTKLAASGAFAAYAAYKAYRTTHPPKPKENADPSIACRGEKVIALEDIPGYNLTYTIRKGEIYTVKSCRADAYTFKECPPEYNPYLGETSAIWFQAKSFQRLTETLA